MQTIIFQIQGKQPQQAELERLSRLPFGSGRPGEAEIKDALKWFFIGIIAGIVLFFFGLWVIKKFVGPGVLFFGYGAVIAAPISVIGGLVSLSKLFRSAHKSKSSAALQWAWMTSILGEDAVGERFGKLPYSMSTMRRLLPEGAGYDDQVFGEYVNVLRNAMARAADETASSLKKEGWHESGPNKSCKITEIKELLPNLHELHAIITYNDQLAWTTNNNKTRYTTSAMLELHITQYYIRSGKYWFPYDFMPVFRREGTA